MRTELEWIGGRYPLPAKVREGDSIIQPEVILWLELPSEVLIGSTLISPKNPVSVAESFKQAMQRPAGGGSPRRPARIRVADERMARELRAAENGIPVIVAPVPELDAAYAELAHAMEEQNEFEPSYLGGGDISPNAIEELFRTASLLYRTNAWQYVSDQQIIRVDIPRYGLDGACLSVIGALEENIGLLLFRSVEDYGAFVRAAEREEAGEPVDDDAGDGTVSLRTLTFDRKQDLPPSMLGEVQHYRWPIAAADAYPRVFCMDSAQTPVPATERDIRIMTASARGFMAFFARHRELFEADDPEPVAESSSGEDGVTVTLTAPYVIYEPPVRRPSVGRNDPCPCGSGKKYKKCHLDADQQPRREASEAETVHEMDARLVRNINRFADRTFGADWLDIDFDEEEEALLQLIVPWITWTAEAGGKRVADAFFERNAGRLSDIEREWFEAQRRAWLSIFEIVHVERGKIGVRDLLTGQQCTVREELASQSLVVRDVVLARLLEFRGASLFGGMYGNALRPSDAEEVIDAVRAKLRLRKRHVPIERLQDQAIGSFMIDTWTDIVDARLSIPPALQNTDSDPLLFVNDSFRFDPADRQKIEQRLAALEGVDIAPATGQESKIVFVRSSDDTVLGHVTIARDTLRIETNSENRAAALRRRVCDACTGMLRDEKRDVQHPPSLSAARLAAPPPPLDASDEEQAMLREYKQQHYRRWLDVPLPALDGKTPRDAARSARLRGDLELVLRDIENIENRLPEEARFDVRFLRNELGMN